MNGIALITHVDPGLLYQFRIEHGVLAVNQPWASDLVFNANGVSPLANTNPPAVSLRFADPSRVSAAIATLANNLAPPVSTPHELVLQNELHQGVLYFMGVTPNPLHNQYKAPFSITRGERGVQLTMTDRKGQFFLETLKLPPVDLKDVATAFNVDLIQPESSNSKNEAKALNQTIGNIMRRFWNGLTPPNSQLDLLELLALKTKHYGNVHVLETETLKIVAEYDAENGTLVLSAEVPAKATANNNADLILNGDVEDFVEDIRRGAYQQAPKSRLSVV